MTPELTPRDILRVCSLSSDLLRMDSLGTTAESAEGRRRVRERPQPGGRAAAATPAAASQPPGTSATGSSTSWATCACSSVGGAGFSCR